MRSPTMPVVRHAPTRIHLRDDPRSEESGDREDAERIGVGNDLVDFVAYAHFGDQVEPERAD